MNHFTITLILAVIMMVGVGWLTFWSLQVSESYERAVRAFLASVLAGLFFTLILVTNYSLAVTGLSRLTGMENVVPKGDPIGRLLFHASKMKVSSLWAVVIVVSSFLAAGMLLSALHRVWTGCRTKAWQTDAAAFWSDAAKLAVCAAVATAFLSLDTYLLVFRSATLMFSDQYAGAASSLPSLGEILHRHGQTMGGALLRLLVICYPMSVLLADMTLASCRARLTEACRAYHAEKAMAESMATGEAQATVPAAPGPVLPPVVAPLPVPMGRLPTNGNGAGGGADWLRPAPFNVGPPGNGS